MSDLPFPCHKLYCVFWSYIYLKLFLSLLLSSLQDFQKSLVTLVSMLFQTYLLKISTKGKWEAFQWNTHCSFSCGIVTLSIFFTPLPSQSVSAV